jgi:hypothetical protein
MQGINIMFFLPLGKGYYLNFSFDKESFLAPHLEKETGGI